MSHLHDEQIKNLELKAVKIRQDIIKMLHTAGTGHSAGSLGMVEVFVALYFHLLHHDPKQPDWSERDRLILSNGHICPVRYAAMARAGYFPLAELATLRQFGSRLQGHPERTRLPGVESTSGPLGEGLAQAAGLAYSARMNDQKWRTYVITSDGEHDCGSHWEAVMFAGKNHLNNLTNIVDRNNIQIDGRTEDVMPLEPLKEKYETFGWQAIDIDGNNLRQIIEAVDQAQAISEKPTCIIAHNIPGHGVDFMENDYRWHGRVPNDQETAEALRQLEEAERSFVSEHETLC